MNLRKRICTMIALLALYISVPVHASGETRNLYIGDIITLELSSQTLSEEELRQKFQDFEIVELTNESGVYSLSIRTFEPGEYTIMIGDKELVIHVGSTLTDIQRDDIFEGETEVLEPGVLFQWHILLYIAAGVFLISSGFILIKTLKKRKAKQESPYEIFLRRASLLSDKDDDYFVELTLFFKQYIEHVHKCRIIGKTTSEISDELNAVPIAKDMLPAIQEWLAKCDIYKFTGMAVSEEEKHHHYTQLLSIAWQIEEKNVEMNEGAV